MVHVFLKDTVVDLNGVLIIQGLCCGSESVLIIQGLCCWSKWSRTAVGLKCHYNSRTSLKLSLLFKDCCAFKWYPFYSRTAVVELLFAVSTWRLTGVLIIQGILSSCTM